MMDGGEQFRAVVAAEARAAVGLVGFYPYVVTQDAGGVTLQPLGDVDGLPVEVRPGQLSVAKAFGVPGGSAQLVAGAQVLLGFEGGDPAKPFVGFYIVGGPTPAAVQVDAQAITLGSSSAVPLAKAGVVNFNFAAVIAKLNQVCTAVGITTMGSVNDCDTSKVKGE